MTVLDSDEEKTSLPVAKKPKPGKARVMFDDSIEVDSDSESGSSKDTGGVKGQGPKVKIIRLTTGGKATKGKSGSEKSSGSSGEKRKAPVKKPRPAAKGRFSDNSEDSLEFGSGSDTYEPPAKKTATAEVSGCLYLEPCAP